jgi:hypothetical protein
MCDVFLPKLLTKTEKKQIKAKGKISSCHANQIMLGYKNKNHPKNTITLQALGHISINNTFPRT